MKPSSERAWFAPKTNGYGASLPISWQGWAAIVVFLVALMLDLSLLAGVARIAGAGVLIVAFGLVCRATTRGGWGWRNGEE